MRAMMTSVLGCALLVLVGCGAEPEPEKGQDLGGSAQEKERAEAKPVLTLADYEAVLAKAIEEKKLARRALDQANQELKDANNAMQRAEQAKRVKGQIEEAIDKREAELKDGLKDIEAAESRNVPPRILDNLREQISKRQAEIEKMRQDLEKVESDMAGDTRAKFESAKAAYDQAEQNDKLAQAACEKADADREQFLKASGDGGQ